MHSAGKFLYRTGKIQGIWFLNTVGILYNVRDNPSLFHESIENIILKNMCPCSKYYTNDTELSFFNEKSANICF